MPLYNNITQSPGSEFSKHGTDQNRQENESILSGPESVEVSNRQEFDVGESYKDSSERDSVG
jgi:hypothetical protein